MNKKVLVTVPFLALSALVSACQSKQEPTSELKADKTVEVKFDTKAMSSFSINPFIYGTFIEHIETCIYDGIWAEMVMDRKFMSPVGEDLSQWYISKGEVEMETENPFEGEYSCLIHSGGEIKQMGLSVDKKEYSGYINAKGKGKITITLKDGDSSVTSSVNVDSNTYKKYTFKITSTFLSKKCQILYTASEGDITLDSVSLMPADNYHGMRLDTLEVLKELNSPFYRWPGGNFVSGYDFYDGIGERDLRPMRRNLNYTMLSSSKIYCDTEEEQLAHDIMCIGALGFYGAFDSNDYGIEEFIDMCRYINAEPNIVVNSGLGEAKQARDEVEFCNGDKTSEYGSKRLLSDKPYDVKIWSVGNEMNGRWQLGNVPLSDYTKRHNEFVIAMKEVDPNIEIIAVGDNGSAWSYGMFEECSEYMDYISEHFYATQYPYDVKEHILSISQMTERRIQNHRQIAKEKGITIAFDEYAYVDADCSSRLKDGMGVASALNAMIKNGDIVDIACYSSTVNATQGNVVTDHLHAYMEGSGYALSLYRNNMQDHYLPLTYIKDVGDEYYEVSATINENKDEMTISVINPSDESILIKNDQFKKAYYMDYVQGDFLDGFNADEREELHRYQEDINYQGGFVILPMSMSVVKVKI